MTAKQVTDAEFESLVQRLANPQITTDGRAKFLVVGSVTYTPPLVTRGVA